MKFITNLDLTRIRNITLIVLIILLSGYIVIRSILLVNKFNEKQEIKQKTEETDKSFC